MSAKAIEIKTQQVAELTETINNSASTVVVEYVGLDVESMKELRNNLRESGAEMKVIKNNISRRAFTQANLEEVATEITGPSAIVYSKDDATAPARVVYEFSKEHDVVKLKAGSLEGKFADSETVKELAQLPNKEGMISMLLSVLEAPIRGLAQVTAQIAEQKEEN